MTIKPFAIQGADLTLGGIKLQAGTTGVVIPGVTQATNSTVAEVNDTGDQTYTFQTPPLVIDYATFYTWQTNGNANGNTFATYEVTLDGEGYIDQIDVTDAGAYSPTLVNMNEGNDMFIYSGSAADPFATFVYTDWTQIPFRPQMRAGTIETIGGGSGGSGLVQRSVNYPLGESGDTKGTMALTSDGRVFVCIQDFVESQQSEFTVYHTTANLGQSGPIAGYNQIVIDLTDSRNSDFLDFLQNPPYNYDASVQVSFDGYDNLVTIYSYGPHYNDNPPYMTYTFVDTFHPPLNDGDTVWIRASSVVQKIWKETDLGELQVVGAGWITTNRYQGGEGSLELDRTSADLWVDNIDGSIAEVWLHNSDTSAPHADINVKAAGGNSGDMRTWVFDAAGTLTFPDGSHQTTAYTGGGTLIPLPSWLTAVAGTHHLPTINVDYGWNSSGVWTTNGTIHGNSPEGTSYPIRTSEPFNGDLTVIITVDFIVNNQGADFGFAIWAGGVVPEWSWATESGGGNVVGAQYNGVWPELHGISGGSGFGGNNPFSLPGPGTYRARLTLAPYDTNTATITLETLDTSNNVLNTISYNETSYPTGTACYIGFASDQDNGVDRTYFKNLAININGSTVVTDALTSYSSGEVGVVDHLSNGSNTLTINSAGDIVLDSSGGAYDRGLIWNWGARNGGTNAGIRHDENGITIQSFNTESGGPWENGTPVNIVTNPGPNQNEWTFDIDGSLIMPGNVVVAMAPVVGAKLAIATNSEGGLGGNGPTTFTVAADPFIISTFTANSTITFNNGDVRTITQIEDFSPAYINIYWDAFTTSDPMFPVTLKTSDYVDAHAGNARIKLVDNSTLVYLGTPVYDQVANYSGDGGPNALIVNKNTLPTTANVTITIESVIVKHYDYTTSAVVTGAVTEFATDYWAIPIGSVDAGPFDLVDIRITIDTTKTWLFGGNGSLTFPGGARVFPDGGSSLAIEAYDGVAITDSNPNWATAAIGDVLHADILIDAQGPGTVSIRQAKKSNDPGSPTINEWTFHPEGDLELPVGGTVRDSTGNDVTVLGLAPQLTKANSQIKIKGTVKMTAIPPGFAIDFDSQGNVDVWFNGSTGDNQGNIYAIGRDWNNNCFLIRYNNDGIMNFTTEFNSIDLGGSIGWQTPEPYTIKWHPDGGGGYIYVGFNLGNYIGASQFDTNGNIVNTWVYTVDNYSNSSLDHHAMEIDTNGYPMFVGQQYGQWLPFNSVTPQTGSGYNVLAVSTADIGNPTAMYDWQTNQWNIDVNGTGNWYQPDNLNRFWDVPVTTVTGIGGAHTVATVTDYASPGGLSIDFSTASPQLVLDTSQWNSGSLYRAQALLAKYSISLSFVCTTDSAYTFSMSGYWVETSTGSGIWTAQGSLAVVAGPSISTVVPITSLTYNNTMHVYTTFNIDSQGRSYYNGFGGITAGGDDYAQGDIVKVPGSLLGGVDGGYILNGLAASHAAGVWYFGITTYPNMDSELPAGTLVRFSQSGDLGEVSGVTDHGDGLWAVAITMTAGTGDSGVVEFYAGNDLTGTWQGGWISQGYSLPVQNKVFFTLSQNIDFRGVENTVAYTSGTDFTSGDYKVFGDGYQSYLVLGNSSTDPINTKLYITPNETVKLTTMGLGTDVPVSISGPYAMVPGTSYRGWLLATNVMGAGGEENINTLTMGNNTYPSGVTWNLRRSDDSNGFVITNDWTRTMGNIGYQSFIAASYDSINNILYAAGDFDIPGASGVVVAFNRNNGDVLWQTNFDDQSGTTDIRGLAADAANNCVYLTYENDNSDVIVVKLSITGEKIWAVHQDSGNNWNQIPEIVVDSNGDPILVGSLSEYNNLSDNYKQELTIIKLKQADGSLVYANSLTRAYHTRTNIRGYYDTDANPANIVNDIIYWGGHASDYNNDYETGMAISLLADGSGLGSYGDWLYHAVTYNDNYRDIVFVPYTNNVILTAQSFPTSTDFAMSYAPYSVSMSGWSFYNSDTTTIGGDSKIVFADDSEITQTGISRTGVDNGGNDITLSASMNGKFRLYDNSLYGYNSYIRLPASYNVALPIGFTFSVAMADFGGVVYVNSNGNSDVWILVSNVDNFSNQYWKFGANGLPGVYTIMKVDTNTWILSGPDIQVD